MNIQKKSVVCQAKGKISEESKHFVKTNNKLLSLIRQINIQDVIYLLF